MESKRHGLVGIGVNVEIGKDGPRIKNTSGVVEFTNQADDAFAKIRADHPTGENDVVTLKYLRTRANIVVTGQINGGSPPAAGTAGRIFMCTTTGGSYTAGVLYYDNGVTWEAVPVEDGTSIKIADDLTGGTLEFLGEHIYVWNADSSTWVDIGPAPADTQMVKTRRITLDYTDTGANNIGAVIEANSIPLEISLNVLQAFDGTNPIIEFGDGVDADRLGAANESNLKKLGVQVIDCEYLYGIATQLLATLTIGGSPTAGQVRITVRYAIQ